MSNAFPDLILADAIATVTTGLVVGLGGEGMRYGNSSSVKNSNRYPHQFKVRVQLKDSTTGASSTVKIQESDDNSSYTDVHSFVMAIGTADPNAVSTERLFKTTKRYVRLNVTAITGGSAPTVSAYMRLGTYGD